MVICQASRMEVEQEELLNLHRSILKSSIRLDEDLQEAIRRAAMEATQHQAFVQTVQDLQEGLARDIKRTQSLFEKTFGRFLHEVETGIDTVVMTFNSAMGHLQNGAVSLGKVWLERRL